MAQAQTTSTSDRLESSQMRLEVGGSVAVAPVSPETLIEVDHGEVFTRRWVVEMILDMVGLSADRDLGATRILEPACGAGAFLVPVVERLVESARVFGRSPETLTGSLVAFDLLPTNVEASRTSVQASLIEMGVAPPTARTLAETWIRQGDFLLSSPQEGSFDYVVGNPPYIRLESVPTDRSDEYRRVCRTMGGRADIYIGFFEQGLHALRSGGVLGFICADRWMRNAYGAKLRELVTAGWSVEAIVSMTEVDAFEDEVDAYPAITTIRRVPQAAGPLVVEGKSSLAKAGALEISELARGEREPSAGPGYSAARLPGWFSGRRAWPHGSPERLAVLAELESRLPVLEDDSTGTRVGIGVATGADKVFITSNPGLVETERLLPLAFPKDISDGEVKWSGRYLINPWSPKGLVDLAEWPKFAQLLRGHEDVLRQRHTARRGDWYRTIDRVIEGLADRPKLYLPDFKARTHPVLDEGTTYPHHNLYWITSEAWDLRVLGGLILSDVANMFIEAYSVRMRGGYLRFQAQFLRQIRIPPLESIDEAAASALATAFDARDPVAATEAALPLYGLDEVPE